MIALVHRSICGVANANYDNVFLSRRLDYMAAE